MVQVEVNPSAPATATASLFVNAPIASVWGVLADLESWPSWNNGVSKMELKGDAEVRHDEARA